MSVLALLEFSALMRDHGLPATVRETFVEQDDNRAATAQLWAQVSHDLRQPIQSLLLLMHVAKGADDRAVLQKTLDYMTNGLESLQDMVEATSLLSRLEAGIVTPKRQSLHLADLIADVEATGWPVAADSRGAKTALEGDRMLLAKALRGLVVLGTHMSTDGVIRVNGRRNGEAVTITCAFRGERMSAGHRKALFADVPPRGGRRGGMVAGVAFIARQAAVMGWTVDVRDAPQGVQKLVLISPG